LALCAAAALLPATLSAATIILTRHAERTGGMSADDPLSPQGRRRAQDLARMLRDSGVKSIFTTEVLRTRQTASPLATELGIKPEVVPSKDIPALATRLKNLAENDVALVVGHSNTLPEIAQMLGAGTVKAIADDEYDRVLIVHTDKDGGASVLTLRYQPAAEK
jgi:phosphohistidine phosphatase SixA